MSESKMVAGFAGYDLTFPHTGTVVHVTVPGFATSCELLRLYEETKYNDGAVVPFLTQFAEVLGFDVAQFDGLTPHEMTGVAARFFSARRDLPPELRAMLEPPVASPSAPSSTESS